MLRVSLPETQVEYNLAAAASEGISSGCIQILSCFHVCADLCRLEVGQPETSLEEDLAAATLEADEEQGAGPFDQDAAEMQPILSRHATPASSKAQPRVQTLDWVRSCSDVETVPGNFSTIASVTLTHGRRGERGGGGGFDFQ